MQTNISMLGQQNLQNLCSLPRLCSEGIDRQVFKDFPNILQFSETNETHIIGFRQVQVSETILGSEAGHTGCAGYASM